MKSLKTCFLLSSNLLLLGSCTGKLQENESKPSRAPAAPNIILVVSDDHGRDDLGSYGNPAIKTPRLDALAAEGIRMTNAYCTSASCSASRSVILTGLYNHANGQFGHTHNYHHFSAFPEVRSLPAILSKSGYHTARIGKYHVAPEEVFRFDTSLDFSGRNVVKMAEECRGYIENTEKPFFLYFCTNDPHRSSEFIEDIPGKPNSFGNRKDGYENVEAKIFSPDSVFVPDYLPDTPECRAELAQYYQSVFRMDQGFGKLFDILKESGKWDNSVVIYLSDNGIAFPGAKTTQYDPGIHLPCIVKYPGCSKPGTENDAMITWADITPTLLDFAGVLPDNNSIPFTEDLPDYREKGWITPVFKNFQGRSFKPVLESGSQEGWNEIFTSHTFHEITMYYPMRVVQDRQFKLIWNIAYPLPYPHASDLWESPTWQSVINSGADNYAGKSLESFTHRPEFELYDMQKDPRELVNLAGRMEYREILEGMKGKMKTWQEESFDPWAVKWTHE